MTHRWHTIAVRLVAATLAYNVIEAVVALKSGAEAESIALFGFGLDSIIECSAAALLLWRLSVEARGATPATVERTERRVHRVVGGTFIALAAYVTLQATVTLWRREPPRASVPGIVLATASLIVMPVLSYWKLRAAREIGSAALRAEAKETLACAYLSLALLVGLVLNASAGLWWADPAAALLMVPWLVKEGREGLRGEGCCDD
jgi:divalent metal cation (Fe/Co/Zn/Cd) transporter